MIAVIANIAVIGETDQIIGSSRANEIQEATVTSNGYSGQFGQLAGAQVNYVTKSGGNQFSANYVWENSLRHLFRWGPNAIFSGWTFSGTVFARSGLPFSVVDNGLSQGLRGNNFGGVVPATVTGPTTTATSCGGDATSFLNSPCLNAAGFLASGSETGFGKQSRNSVRGPNFFDTDFAVMKTVKVKERASLGFGVQFFNLLKCNLA